VPATQGILVIWLVFKQSRMEGKPWSNSATGAGKSRDSQKVHQDNAYCGDETTVRTDCSGGRRPVGDSLLARNSARFADLQEAVAERAPKSKRTLSNP
jgi:hypothetical protein